MPAAGFGAGIGSASRNSVKTGAMNDIGQATSSENTRHSAVPTPSLIVRSEAISTVAQTM